MPHIIPCGTSSLQFSSDLMLGRWSAGCGGVAVNRKLEKYWKPLVSICASSVCLLLPPSVHPSLCCKVLVPVKGSLRRGN